MTKPSDIDVAGLSDALMQARRMARPVSEFPGQVPSTLQDAYAVQIRSIAAWHDELVGFKVGGIAPHFHQLFPSRWLAGPIFETTVHRVANSGHVEVQVFNKGFAAYEAEFVFLLSGLDKLPSDVVSLEACIDYIEAVHIGAEIASSPMPMVNALGPGSIISDFGNNAGLVIGPKIDVSTLGHLPNIDVTLKIGGYVISQLTPKPGASGPLGALQFLLSHLAKYRDTLDLPDKLYLSSGAITGVHESRVGTFCEIGYGELGAFSISMTAISSV